MLRRLLFRAPEGRYLDFDLVRSWAAPVPLEFLGLRGPNLSDDPKLGRQEEDDRLTDPLGDDGEPEAGVLVQRFWTPSRRCTTSTISTY